MKISLLLLSAVQGSFISPSDIDGAAMIPVDMAAAAIVEDNLGSGDGSTTTPVTSTTLPGVVTTTPAVITTTPAVTTTTPKTTSTAKETKPTAAPVFTKAEVVASLDLPLQFTYSADLEDPSSDEYKSAESETVAFLTAAFSGMAEDGKKLLSVSVKGFKQLDLSRRRRSAPWYMQMVRSRRNAVNDVVAETESVFETSQPEGSAPADIASGLASTAAAAINTAAANGASGLVSATLNLSGSDMTVPEPVLETVACCSNFVIKYPYHMDLDIPNHQRYFLKKNTGHAHPVYIEENWRYVITKAQNNVDWTMYKGTFLDLVDGTIDKAMFLYGDAVTDGCIDDLTRDNWYATSKGSWEKVKLHLACIN